MGIRGKGSEVRGWGLGSGVRFRGSGLGSLRKRKFGRWRDDTARCDACRGGFGQGSESSPLNAVHS